jgi:hypothetical protein
VLAGISFVGRSGVPNTGLTTLAGYPVLGALWFLVGATLLIRTPSESSE